MTDDRPLVLFVCKSNAGKSQMAEALLREIAGDAITAVSAGTAPGSAINDQSAVAVGEVGADMSGGTPKPVDPELVRIADRVVVLGREAQLEPVDGMTAGIERWETDEPAERGIGGMQRMRLIRDDIAARVRDLATDLTTKRGGNV